MRLFIYLFRSIFVFAGVVVAVYGIHILLLAKKSTHWPQVQGEVTKSEISCHDGTYEPMIAYTFSVGGQIHHGTQIGFGNKISTSDGRHASTYCVKYSVGEKVSVYYDPEVPLSSVLEPGATKKTYIIFAFGLGFGLFGAWFCLLFWLAE